MKTLVIGGTGFIGRAVVSRLQDAGHQPVVLVRDPSRAPDGVPSVAGDLADAASLRSALTPDIDAVVHTATPTGDWEVDLAALECLTEALQGKTLVYLSGIWVLGASANPLDETAPTNPIELVSGRPRLERHVLEAANVRGIVIRPGIVHGNGGGIPGMMTDWARHAGVGRFVGEPTVHWPMVHVDDLADLVVLAAERAAAGAVLHAVAEQAVPVKELAAAADLAAGGRGQAESWPEREAAAELGAPFAAALALHQEVRAVASAGLGWVPAHLDAVGEIRSGTKGAAVQVDDRLHPRMLEGSSDARRVRG